MVAPLIDLSVYIWLECGAIARLTIVNCFFIVDVPSTVRLRMPSHHVYR